ncbi:Fis family transcriptional regulator [Gammaproteobacteria bacterium 50_400_T64]|nr:Fis family transcriptional regulator [Gammaproteobacteria bacterium 50_400_T64]
MNSVHKHAFEYSDQLPDSGSSSQTHSLRYCVERAMEEYFSHLDGQSCTDLYQLVLQEVEDPLLTAVMKYTRNNQSKASEMLGLNRGTLRKKLKLYDLL